MKSHFVLSCFLFISSVTYSQQEAWKIVEGKILTPWAEKVSPQNVLPEYPRPQMVREGWQNLNGLWSYAIVPANSEKPSSYQGRILVPFPVESALSGVGKRVGKENALWYRRTVKLPSAFRGKKILLHIGAADWQCEAFVNGTSVGTHEGGYDPFAFDITAQLKRSGDEEIVIRVWDPTDEGPQPRGKQVREPNSIWYTPVTGLWQTVWLEAVSDAYISGLRITPDFDSRKVNVKAEVENMKDGDRVVVTALYVGKKVASSDAAGTEATLDIPDPQVWAPGSPHLYDLQITVIRRGKTLDNVKSYFALRKISMEKDANGVQRMLLNNQFVFQYGPLDQGWWPDGLYTAPTEEALKFDIEKTREMGFNMIRKHVKVEPARWYYHCDKMGVLVWQDMPSGDMGNRWDSRPGIVGIATEKERTPESEAIFRKEWKAIIDATYNFPCIVVWVPFNEAWGQFKTNEIVQWTMKYDPSRLVNGASGGNFTATGHIIDLHNYPSPAMPEPKLFGKDQIIVLGEFGGLGLPLEGHTWQEKDNWGYQSFSSGEELISKYHAFIQSITQLIPQGLSAAVYTQTTDVEIEINGLMTYDRKVIKIPTEKLHSFHKALYEVNINTTKAK